MNRKVVGLVIVFLILLVATQASADTIGIDNFNTADQDLCDPTTVCGDAATSSSVAYGSAIGGFRDMVVTRTGGPGNVTAETGFGGDLAAYSQDTITRGTWEIIWDGDNVQGNLNMGLGADITDGGTNTQVIFGSFTNDQVFDLTIEVYTTATDFSRAVLTQPVQSGVTLAIPFTSFAPAGGAGVTVTNVNAIRVFVDGSTVDALDVSFDYITVEDPTPTAISLDSIGAGEQAVWFPFAVGTLLLVLFSSSVYITRKRQSAK